MVWTSSKYMSKKPKSNSKICDETHSDHAIIWRLRVARSHLIPVPSSAHLKRTRIIIYLGFDEYKKTAFNPLELTRFSRSGIVLSNRATNYRRPEFHPAPSRTSPANHAHPDPCAVHR